MAGLIRSALTLPRMATMARPFSLSFSTVTVEPSTPLDARLELGAKRLKNPLHGVTNFPPYHVDYEEKNRLSLVKMLNGEELNLADLAADDAAETRHKIRDMVYNQGIPCKYAEVYADASKEEITAFIKKLLVTDRADLEAIRLHHDNGAFDSAFMSTAEIVHQMLLSGLSRHYSDTFMRDLLSIFYKDNLSGLARFYKENESALNGLVIKVAPAAYLKASEAHLQTLDALPNQWILRELLLLGVTLPKFPAFAAHLAKTTTPLSHATATLGWSAAEQQSSARSIVYDA